MNPYMENLNYYNDSRVKGASFNRGKTVENERGEQFIEFITEDDDWEEITHHLPAKFAVCDVCDGKGKHVNPSIDSGGLSSEDFYEDPGFAEDYMSGAYDVTCYTCGGKRVVLVVDERECNKDLLKLYEDDLQQQAWDYDERAQERRMGC